jgi:hypothetical protein
MTVNNDFTGCGRCLLINNTDTYRFFGLVAPPTFGIRAMINVLQEHCISLGFHALLIVPGQFIPRYIVLASVAAIRES